MHYCLMKLITKQQTTNFDDLEWKKCNLIDCALANSFKRSTSPRQVVLSIIGYDNAFKE